MTAREEESVVEELNEKHAVLSGAGKVKVMRFAPDGTFTLESEYDFRIWYANRTIKVIQATAKGEPKETEVSYGNFWMKHPERRQYERIVFDPRAKPTQASDSEERIESFNLWRGFSVQPNALLGDCEIFLDHLRANVCGGNAKHYQWLLGWMAHLIQRPWEKPCVAVALKGAKGVGKTIVGEILGELLKHHTVTVSQPSHLVGKFNAHLARAVLVLVEEAFWAGDKTAEGALKDQITGATIRVERKGFDVEELPSFHRYLITGNADWMIPATNEDRRWAMFKVGAERMQDRRYFGAMMEEMRTGGYEALMHLLLEFDLSSVDVFIAPRTQGLAEQQIANLQNVQRWWFDALTTGALPGCENPKRDWTGGAVTVETVEFRTAYEHWHRAHRYQGELASEEAFGRDLRAMCPSVENVQLRKSGDRSRFYKLPRLGKCRAEFEEWLRCDLIGLDWPA